MENVQLSLTRRPKRKPRRYHYTIEQKLKDCPDMPYKDFYGYTVFQDGHTFNPWGWELRLQHDKCRRTFYAFKINGKQKMIRLALLLATLYIPNPDNLPDIVFIDGNPDNITVNNIKWASYEEKKKTRRKKRKLTHDQKVSIAIDTQMALNGPCEVKKFGTATVLSCGVVVDRYGRVRKDVNEKSKNGAFAVCIDGKRYQLKEIIASLFVPNPDGLTYVEVINKNPKDCRSSNLKWGNDPVIKYKNWISASEKFEAAVSLRLQQNPSLKYTMFAGYVVFDDGVFINRYGKEIKPSIYKRNNAKYADHEIPLTFNGKHRCWKTRYIIATLFVPNPYGYQYVAVKDGDIYNVSASNLYWTNKKKPVPRKELDTDKVANILLGLDRNKLSEADRAIYDVLNGDSSAILSFIYPYKEIFICWNIKRTEGRICYERSYDIFYEAMFDLIDHIKLGKLLPVYGKPNERLFAYLYLQIIHKTSLAYGKFAKEKVLPLCDLSDSLTLIADPAEFEEY